MRLWSTRMVVVDCRKNFERSRGRKLRHLPQLEMRYVGSQLLPYRTARLSLAKLRARLGDDFPLKDVRPRPLSTCL